MSLIAPHGRTGVPRDGAEQGAEREREPQHRASKEDPAASIGVSRAAGSRDRCRGLPRGAHAHSYRRQLSAARPAQFDWRAGLDQARPASSGKRRRVLQPRLGSSLSRVAPQASSAGLRPTSRQGAERHRDRSSRYLQARLLYCALLSQELAPISVQPLFGQRLPTADAAAAEPAKSPLQQQSRGASSQLALLRPVRSATNFRGRPPSNTGCGLEACSGVRPRPGWQVLLLCAAASARSRRKLPVGAAQRRDLGLPGPDLVVQFDQAGCAGTVSAWLRASFCLSGFRSTFWSTRRCAGRGIAHARVPVLEQRRSGADAGGRAALLAPAAHVCARNRSNRRASKRRRSA